MLAKNRHIFLNLPLLLQSSVKLCDNSAPQNALLSSTSFFRVALCTTPCMWAFLFHHQVPDRVGGLKTSNSTPQAVFWHRHSIFGHVQPEIFKQNQYFTYARRTQEGLEC